MDKSLNFTTVISYMFQFVQDGLFHAPKLGHAKVPKHGYKTEKRTKIFDLPRRGESMFSVKKKRGEPSTVDFLSTLEFIVWNFFRTIGVRFPKNEDWDKQNLEDILKNEYYPKFAALDGESFPSPSYKYPYALFFYDTQVYSNTSPYKAREGVVRATVGNISRIASKKSFYQRGQFPLSTHGADREEKHEDPDEEVYKKVWDKSCARYCPTTKTSKLENIPFHVIASWKKEEFQCKDSLKQIITKTLKQKKQTVKATMATYNTMRPTCPFTEILKDIRFSLFVKLFYFSTHVFPFLITSAKEKRYFKNRGNAEWIKAWISRDFVFPLHKVFRDFKEVNFKGKEFLDRVVFPPLTGPQICPFEGFPCKKRKTSCAYNDLSLWREWSSGVT